MSSPSQERADQPIGQIAVQLPGATAIFRRLKLDFCCGGQVSLRQACENKHLAIEQVLAELATLERPQTDATPLAPGALIQHILERYHAVHRDQLPELLRMARRVEAVHRDHPDVPAGLADHLELMENELLDHMTTEEEILFPMLTSQTHTLSEAPIDAMRQEHTNHGQLLDRLLSLTNDATPPAGACNTWRALYAGIDQFQSDLIQHIHLENNLLFPTFESPVEPCCPR